MSSKIDLKKKKKMKRENTKMKNSSNSKNRTTKFSRANERNLCRAIRRAASFVSATNESRRSRVPGDNFKGRPGTCCTYATFSRITFRTFRPSYEARRILSRSSVAPRCGEEWNGGCGSRCGSWPFKSSFIRNSD